FFADVRLQKDPESGDRVIAGSAVEDARPLFEIIDDGGDGEMIHLRTGKAAAPKFPFKVGDLAAFDTKAGEGEKPLRHQAAEWLTSPENPYFASSYVNRVWAHLTGVGFIEPIDDIRAGNPPTNPELLERLTDDFIASNFDVQQLIRTICLSRTYQLSHETNRWNADDKRNYSHALPRRLPAEALFDAVHQVVGSVTQIPGVPPGTRAAEVAGPMIELESGLLSKLGRPARESGCECERTSELQLGPVMALLNGPAFAQAINNPDSELAKLEAATADDGALVDEVFLRVLNRAPTAEERAAGVEMLQTPSKASAAIADALQARTDALAAGFDQWRIENRPVRWQTLEPLEAASSVGAQLEVQSDGSIFSSGATGQGTYTVRAEAPAQPIRGLRIEALADDRLPAKGPGRAPNGNFVLSRLRVFASPVDKPDERRKLKIVEAQADFNQPGYHVSGAIDGKPETGWAIMGGVGQNRTAVFRFSRPLTPEEGTRLIVELDQQYPDGAHMLGRFRISATDEEPPLFRNEHPPQWRALLAARRLSDAEAQKLLDYYLSLDAEYRELQATQRLVADPRLMAVQDLAWALINSPAFLFNH
ncbi:MAG TPA: DUF1553 domain-containing protein, partial [Lacipirellula sp.]